MALHLVRGGNQASAVAQHPKLQLIVGDLQSGSATPVSNDISDHFGVPDHEEVTPSFSEMVGMEKTPKHQAALDDVALFHAGLMSATELKRLHEKTYKNWDGMKQRCKGRPEAGIPPIELSKSFDKFADFLALAGPRPFESWSIDRINPVGPYSPENCRWASKTVQSRNRTNTIFLTYKGVTRPLVEWAELLGENPETLRNRKRTGWTDEEIIEGKRKAQPLAANLTATDSSDAFAYTPWPTKFREVLERHYQSHRRHGEHRLTFMRRIAEEQMNKCAESAEDFSWPDDYSPSEAELKESERLAKQHRRWADVYQEACRLIAGNFRARPFGRDKLPSWVESKLERFKSA